MKINYKKLAFKILVVLIIIGLLVFSPLIVGFAKTGRNTKVLNRDYSLLSQSQIISRLQTDFPLSQTLTLVGPDQSFQLNLASISAQVDSKTLASNLLFRRLNQGIKKYFLAFFQPKTFFLEIKYNSEDLDKYLDNIASQVNRPFVPSELAIDNQKQIIIKNGQIGRQVDVSLLEDQIVWALKNYQIDSSFTIPLDQIGQIPDEQSIENTKNIAKKIIGKNLHLISADQNIIVNDQILVSWLDFQSPCLSQKISDYVNNLQSSLKKDPIDAVFKFENNQVLEFRPSADGYSLDISKLISAICPKVQELIVSYDKNINLELPLIFVPPKITNSQVNNLGIKELLGKGVSTFHHSSTVRNFNVQKGASIVNRILVAPGETFSFIKNLGEVTLENGYKKAYIIRQGKTELDVGGGICQVSTTLFRAMLNSGLDITQRQNHAYRVSYYEEDMPPGYDATVFIPSPDLKFVNDTGNYVLIQSLYEDKLKKLTYEIYGTSDGRRVEISNYRQWDSQPAPPDVYIDDPTLPAGKVIKDESRVPGLKTAFDWKVTRSGEVIHQKTFQSVYTPWAAVYRRGIQSN